MNDKINLRFGIIALMIVLAAATRFFLPPNLTSIGAIALFGGAYFASKKWAYLIPFLALWISNLVLNNVFYAEYYEGFVWFANPLIYVSFFLVVLIGQYFLKQVKPGRLLVASLAASVLFFLISNLDAFLFWNLYPKTWAGLVACYTAAIPFFWNTLAGDLLFTVVLFGAFEFMKYRMPQLKLA